MKRWLGFLLLVLAGGVAVPGLAATYTLPNGALPANCTRTSSTLVTCTSLNLNNNGDTIIVTAPITLQVNGNFNYAQTVQINQGGATSNLTMNVTGSWNGGNGGHFNANLNVASITLQQNSYVGGNLVASGTISANSNNNQFAGSVSAGGNIALGGNNTVGGGLASTGGNVTFSYGSVGAGVSVPNGSFTTGSNSNGVQITGDVAVRNNIYLDINSTVTGNVTSSNGTLETNNYVHIYGNATAEGKITLGNWTKVDGNVHSVSGGVETKNEVEIGGGIDASGTITLGFQSQITGNVQTDNGGVNINNGVQINGSIIATGDVYLGYQSDVDGNVETGGGVNTGQQVTVGGSIVAGGDVTLNWQDNIGGNINTPGAVTGNGSTVGGYVNTGTGTAPGVSAGTVCDTDPQYQDSNYSPCPGYEPEPEVLYYKLTTTGSALTCEPLVVAVQACADAGCTTLATITGSVDVTVTGPAIVAPSTAGFSDSGASATSLALTTPGTYTLGLASISVPADQPFQCDPGDCAVSVDGTGVAFVWSNIPVQTAGSTFSATLAAPSCGGAFEDQSVSVALSLECEDPGACYAASLLTAQGVPLAEDPGVALPLTFDTLSMALVNFNYEDAGRITLKARATLPGGVVVEGSSNSFVVRPASIGFAVHNPANSGNSDGDPGDGVFARAGDDFEVTLQALSATGAITPNFGNESSPALLTLEGDAQVVNPTDPGVTDGPVFVLQAFSKTASGTFSSGQVRYGEVGEAKFSGYVVGGDYLGSGPLVAQDAAAKGIFIPWHFSVQGGAAAPVCSAVAPGFTYMGQDFLADLQIGAWARLGDGTFRIAENYAGALAQASVQWVGANLAPASDLSARLDFAVPAPNWILGIGSLNGVPIQVQKVSPNPDGPYPQFQLGARVVQSGVLFGDADFNAADPDCVANGTCNATKVGTPFAIAHGRLVVTDTFGAETGTLPVTIEAQYWNGSSFVRANNVGNGIYDSCTVVSYENLQVETGVDCAVPPPGYAAQGTSTSVTLNAGRTPGGAITWPPLGDTGTLCFAYESDEEEDGWWNDEDDSSSQANATFGSYRGHDRIIDWQILPLP